MVTNTDHKTKEKLKKSFESSRTFIPCSEKSSTDLLRWTESSTDLKKHYEITTILNFYILISYYLFIVT